MKAIVQWVIVYGVIFMLVAGFILYSQGVQGGNTLSWNDTVGVVKGAFYGLWNSGKSTVEGITQVELINKEDLYKYSPKLCKIDKPFSCDEFLLNADLAQMILVLKKEDRITPTGAEIHGGISCLSELAEGEDNRVYVKFYNCSIEKNYAKITISYNKISSDLEHKASGLVTLGLQ